LAQQHSNIIHGSIGKKDPFAPNNWALNYGPCNASFINSIGSCLPSWPRDCNGTWIKTHILVSIGSNQATRSSQFSHFLAYTYKNGLPTYPFCTAIQSIMDRNGAQPFIYVTNKCQMMPPCRLPPSNQCMLVEVKVSTGNRDGNKPATRGYPTRPVQKTRPAPLRLCNRVSGRVFKLKRVFNRVFNGSGFIKKPELTRNIF
jgi:hypothetical protein